MGLFTFSSRSTCSWTGVGDEGTSKAAPCWRDGTIRVRTRRRRWTAPTTAKTRLVEEMGMTPVVPPKANGKVERNCDKDLCKLRNEVERLFQRLKGCRRIRTRFDKLDAMFPGFLNLVCRRPCNTGFFLVQFRESGQALSRVRLVGAAH